MKLIFLPITFALFLVTCFAQDIKITEDKVIEQKPVKVINKITNISGWSIPIVNERDLVNSRTIKIENQSVIFKAYKLQKPIEIQFEFYSLNADNSLNIGFVDVELKGIASFSINGKIFGYRIISIPFEAPNKGTKYFMGHLDIDFYTDEDGDGKFETRCIRNELPTTLPAWTYSQKRPVIK